MINVSHPVDPPQMDGNHSFPKWMGMAHCHIGNQGVGGSIKVTICLPDPPENGDWITYLLFFMIGFICLFKYLYISYFFHEFIHNKKDLINKRHTKITTPQLHLLAFP